LPTFEKDDNDDELMMNMSITMLLHSSNMDTRQTWAVSQDTH